MELLIKYNIIYYIFLLIFNFCFYYCFFSLFRQNKRTIEICCCGGHERYKCLLDQFYKEIDVYILFN